MGGLICYVLTRRGKGIASAVLLAFLAALLLWLWLQARAAIGWDALGYAIFAMFLVAPALVGGALGSLIGRKRCNRHQNRSSD